MSIELTNLPQTIKNLEDEWLKGTFHAWATGNDYVERPPFYLYMEITNACNLRCVHCPQKMMTRPVGFMDFDEYKKIIDEVAGKIPWISLYRQGEPLMHPRFLDMLKYAKDKGIKVDIFTNAMFLDKEKAEAIIDIGIDMISFTGRGDKESYEELMLRANFDKMVKNVGYFLKYRKKKKAKNITVHAVFVEYPDTPKQQLDLFYKLFKNKLKVDYAYTNKLVYFPGNFDSGKKPAGFPKEPINHNVCIYPWQLVGISWNGNVAPCVFDGHDRVTVGNAFKEGFFNIWNGEKMRAFRSALVKRDFSFEPEYPLCSACSVLYDPSRQHCGLFYTNYDKDVEFQKRLGELEQLAGKNKANQEAIYAYGLNLLIKGDLRGAGTQWHKLFAIDPFSSYSENARKYLKTALSAQIYTN